MRPTFCLLSLASVKDSNHLISRRIGYSVRAGLKMQMKSTADIYSGGSWRIWEVIEHLETEGLTVCNTLSADTLRYDDNQRTTITTVPTASIPQYSQRVNTLTIETIKILKEWGDKWVGQPEWQTLLNKKSLLHEIEESITALSFLFDWLEKRCDNTPVTLVDVCCGKGILSMLASYLCQNMQSVTGIIMLDIQTDINWSHIRASNANAKDEGRPIIQTLGGCNLNELDSMIDLLQKEQSSNNGQYALIGIHLCKLLSPSCAGLANTLGKDKCTFLCLAPCCMPRAVLKSKKKLAHLKMGSTVSVRTYESIEEREARRAANALRAGAKARAFPCYLCADMGHSVKKCSLLPCNESERISIFEHAEAQIPCWKCGKIGHVRADCTSAQESSKPPLTLPPTIELDVSTILHTPTSETAKGPFQCYCELLATALDKEHANVYDVGLVNQNAEHNNQANQNNWNRDRKSIYIVATS